MSVLSRREVVTGLLATPLILRAAAHEDTDVAIIGAGAAGMAAARQLQASGLRAVIFEARNRVGGRTFTDSTALDRPFDFGAHWIHVPDINPMTQHATTKGHKLIRSDPEDATFFRDGSAVPEAPQLIDKAGERMEGRSRLPLMFGQDRPLSAMVRQDQWERIAAAIQGIGMAVEPHEISLRDLASLAEGPDVMVEAGYGALVATLSEGLDIRLSSLVESVRWGRNARVELEGSFGKATARACIVTVPTALLARGAPRFDPPLPQRTQNAFENLPLGNFEKIGMRLSRPLHGFTEYSMDLDITLGGRAHALHLSPDRKLATVLATGDCARGLLNEGPRAAEAFGREVLARLAGQEAQVEAIVTTNWRDDPYALGSYSHSRVGQFRARKDYDEPVGDCIFFAGEAGSGSQAVTVGGAVLSGQRAARNSATAIRARSAPSTRR